MGSEKQLSALADERYQRVVELDPDNEEAHKALQHVKEGNVWVSKKEQMEQRGLERVGGRNVSKQEAELIRAKEAEKEETRYWKKQIAFLYQGAKNDNQRAKEDLRRIKNPIALPVLVKTYTEEKRDPEDACCSSKQLPDWHACGVRATWSNRAERPCHGRRAALSTVSTKRTARTKLLSSLESCELRTRRDD